MKKIISIILLLLISISLLCSCSNVKTGYVWYQIGENDTELYNKAIEQGMGLTIPDSAEITVLHDSVTEECTGFAIIKASLSNCTVDTLKEISNIAEWSLYDIDSKVEENFKKAHETLGINEPDRNGAYHYFKYEENGTTASTSAIWNNSTKELYIVFILTLDVNAE